MVRKCLLTFVSAACLWSCSPTVDTRGNLPAPAALAKIVVGETNEEQAQSILGTPSTVTTYGDLTWHYVYQKIETVSFFKPKELDYVTVTLVFDGDGKVKSISRLGKKDRKNVETVTRETPTAGKEYSVIEQLIGNVGKFSKAGSTPTH